MVRQKSWLRSAPAASVLLCVDAWSGPPQHACTTSQAVRRGSLCPASYPEERCPICWGAAVHGLGRVTRSPLRAWPAPQAPYLLALQAIMKPARSYSRCCGALRESMPLDSLCCRQAPPSSSNTSIWTCRGIARPRTRLRWSLIYRRSWSASCRCWPLSSLEFCFSRFHVVLLDAQHACPPLYKTGCGLCCRCSWRRRRRDPVSPLAQAGCTLQAALEHPANPCPCAVCEAAAVFEGQPPQPLQGPLPRVAAIALAHGFGCAPPRTLAEASALLSAVQEVCFPTCSVVLSCCACVPRQPPA